MKSCRYLVYCGLLALVLAACGRTPEAVETVEPATSAPLPTEALEPTPTLAGGVATLPPPVVVVPEEGPGGEASPTDAPAEPETEAPQPTPTPGGPLAPWQADDFGFGIQSHAVVGDPRIAMDAIANQLGMSWVKVQVEWPLVEPDPGFYQWFFYDGVVDEAARHNLRLMLSVVGAPAWSRAAGGEHSPPDDYATYAAFLDQLLTRYAGRVHAIEVGNEQNLDREWLSPRGLSAADYVQFLATAYDTIKAHDPNIIVISGALAPTGVNNANARDDFGFLDQMLAAGLLDYADCVGAHHNGYNIGPAVTANGAPSDPEAATAVFRGPFNSPHHSWSFATTLATYAEKIQAIDPAKKLCVTEFGWASVEGYDSYPQNFEFALDNTLEEQAQFIVEAFEQMRASGDVWLAFLFNFDFGPKGNGPTDDPVPYSILDLNGVPRPAFGALAEMEKSPAIGQ
jgi:hypothetical protein